MLWSRAVLHPAIGPELLPPAGPGTAWSLDARTLRELAPMRAEWDDEAGRWTAEEEATAAQAGTGAPQGQPGEADGGEWA